MCEPQHEASSPGTPSKGGRASRFLVSVALFWILALSVAARAIWAYQTTPGASGDPPATWPEASRLVRVEGRSELVVFVHPRCPCTRATFSELAEILRRFPDSVNAHVVFMRPDGVGRDWTESDTWRTASRMPGVAAVLDDRGAETELFRSATSGDIAFYGPDGRLLYSGGITASRGHEGDNAGRRRVLHLLADGRSDASNGDVYGCPLGDEGYAR
jgi:hypothetical protein